MNKFMRRHAIAEIFRITRIINKYEQTDMGNIFGCSKSLICLIENHKRPIPEEMVEQFLLTFNLSHDNFGKACDNVSKLLTKEPVDWLKIHFIVVKLLMTAKK